MARVLLLTVDVDLPESPVNGGVLRVRQLKRHLEELGHEVLASMPFDRLTDLGAPAEALAAAYPEGHPQVAVEAVKPDVILCEQWHLASVLGPHRAPLWLDLHGSLLGENAFRQAGGGETHARYDQEARAKLRAFADAEVITCAGHRQRLYFRGWRAIAGRSFDDWEVFHLPLAIDARFPKKPRPHDADGRLRLLYAGNLWPWINLQSWLPDFFDVIAARPEISVDFFVDDPLRQRNAATVIEEAAPGESWKRLHAEKRVRISGRIPHEEYVERVSQYDAAIDLFAWNSERELALTTRTLEYLSFGLPVIYPSHAELAETISEIDPRWVVEKPDRESLAVAVESLIETRSETSAQLDRIRSVLESRSKQALSRCRDLMAQLEKSDRVGRPVGVGKKRLVSLANDVVRSSLTELRDRFGKETARTDTVRNETLQLSKQVREQHERISELELALAARDREVSAFDASAREHTRERKSWQRELSDAHRRTKELSDRHSAEVAALEDTFQKSTEQSSRSMAELREQHARGEQQLQREIDGLRRDHAGQQVATRLLSARPELGVRGFGRRMRLFALFVDHLAVRLYLSLWQKLKRRRIFPGM